jgi:serine/threonine-protein kinase
MTFKVEFQQDRRCLTSLERVPGKQVLRTKVFIQDRGGDTTCRHPGNILRQDVPGGNKVRERRGIKVVISKGPRITSVPMLVNEPLVNAETLLIQKGLKISRVILVHSDLVEKDRVISQKPAPDEPVSDLIQVIVSLGPYEKLYTLSRL